MKRILAVAVIAIGVAVSRAHAAPERLLIYAGAASKPPTEEAVRQFKQKTGGDADVIFGGSGFVLSQMKLAKKGDLFFPGSSDFMELAKREGLVFPESERIVVYLVPAINVQRGNPKGIVFLKDLARGGLRIALANPEMVCVGMYAVEIVEKNLTPSEKARFKKNLVNYTESCEKTAGIISLKGVDAVLGWEVFQHWDPERIETILLEPETIPRIGYIPVAIARFTGNRPLAQGFIDFLLSAEGKAIFRKYRYLMDLQEARRFTRRDTPVGGTYLLPDEWKAGEVRKRK